MPLNGTLGNVTMETKACTLLYDKRHKGSDVTMETKACSLL
jgi:hypothetical protein